MSDLDTIPRDYDRRDPALGTYRAARDATDRMIHAWLPALAWLAFAVGLALTIYGG